MKVEDILREERNPHFEYSEKYVKNVLSKVILCLRGNESATMSRLMTRYKRLEEQAERLAAKREQLNKEVKEAADSLFSAHDAWVTRVIETGKYLITLTRATPASEKEPIKKVDFEKAFRAMQALSPELKAAGDELEKQFTEFIPPKDTPTALRYSTKVEEGVSDVIKAMVAKAKAFAKEMFSWGKRYDAKLAEIAKKYNIKPAKV